MEAMEEEVRRTALQGALLDEEDLLEHMKDHLRRVRKMAGTSTTTPLLIQMTSDHVLWQDTQGMSIVVTEEACIPFSPALLGRLANIPGNDMGLMLRRAVDPLTHWRDRAKRAREVLDIPLLIRHSCHLREENIGLYFDDVYSWLRLIQGLAIPTLEVQLGERAGGLDSECGITPFHRTGKFTVFNGISEGKKRPDCRVRIDLDMSGYFADRPGIAPLLSRQVNQ